MSKINQTPLQLAVKKRLRYNQANTAKLRAFNELGIDTHAYVPFSTLKNGDRFVRILTGKLFVKIGSNQAHLDRDSVHVVEFLHDDLCIVIPVCGTKYTADHDKVYEFLKARSRDFLPMRFITAAVDVTNATAILSDLVELGLVEVIDNSDEGFPDSYRVWTEGRKH